MDYDDLTSRFEELSPVERMRGHKGATDKKAHKQIFQRCNSTDMIRFLLSETYMPREDERYGYTLHVNYKMVKHNVNLKFQILNPEKKVFSGVMTLPMNGSYHPWMQANEKDKVPILLESHLIANQITNFRLQLLNRMQLEGHNVLYTTADLATRVLDEYQMRVQSAYFTIQKKGGHANNFEESYLIGLLSKILPRDEARSHFRVYIKIDSTVERLDRYKRASCLDRSRMIHDSNPFLHLGVDELETSARRAIHELKANR